MAIGEKNGKSEVGSEFNLSDFTSTTKLSDDKNGQYGELYVPFEHRIVEKPNSDLGVLMHLLKGSLGTGILAMPMAFLNGGLIFGLLGTIIIGYVCTHCVYMLVSSSHTACRKAKIPSLGYSETAETVFRIGPEKIRKYSRAAGLFVEWSLIVTYYSAACVYVVFIADSFLAVAEVYQPKLFDVRHFMLIIYLPLIGLALIRNLKWLIPFSSMANILILISFIITLYYMFKDGISINEDTHYFAQKVVGVPLFFSTVIFAMEGIGVVMPLENSMKTPQHFLGCPGVLNIAMGCVVTLYAVIGFFGYAKYGTDTQSSITLNVNVQEWPGQVVQICIGLAIFCTYGLQFYVPSKLSWELMKPKIPSKFHFISETIFRIFMVSVNVGIAAGVPHLGPFISLVGAVCFSNLGLLIPAFMDSVCRWDGRLGRYRWRLIKNIIIIIFSLIALVSGAYSSIQEMIG